MGFVALLCAGLSAVRRAVHQQLPVALGAQSAATVGKSLDEGNTGL